MDKHSKLEEQRIEFEVYQEVTPQETLQIGKLRLNLAEYANGEGRGREDDVVVRRYLMQDSKINSTLKVGIGMHQVDGETNFIAPPLRAAAVFEGFTGIIASEQDQEGVQTKGGKQPTGPSAELNELQDMYRLALAASWACGGSGELAADKCVEDIFAGGDGWGNRPQPATDNPALSLRPDARRGSLRTWTNDESEDEGMGTATPANRESWASRTRRRIHTPRGTRTRDDVSLQENRSGSRSEDRNETKSLQEERSDQRSLRERSLRYETRERELPSSRSLFETRSLRSRSDQRSTRFDLGSDEPGDREPHVPSRTASEHSRASVMSTSQISHASDSIHSQAKPSKASSIRTTSSASLSTHDTIGSRPLHTRNQQISGAVYDPVDPLSRTTHFPGSPSLVTGDMTSMRGMGMGMRAPKSPQSVRFPQTRALSPKRESHSLRPGSSSSWGGKSRRKEEVLEWDVREDLRAWKVPNSESKLEDAGVARTGPDAVKSKSEKGGDGCNEDKKKTGGSADDIAGRRER